MTMKLPGLEVAKDSLRLLRIALGKERDLNLWPKESNDLFFLLQGPLGSKVNKINAFDKF